MKENDYPALYRSANELSLASQRHFFFALFLNLSSLVLASILSVFYTTNAFFSHCQIFALLVSLGCTVYLGSIRPEKKWYGGRALSESVKTTTWRYIMKAEPYNKSNEISHSLFLNILSSLINDNREISKEAMQYSSELQISNKMDKTRNELLKNRKEFYLKNRISEQLTWYVKKAHFNNKMATIFFLSICAVNIAAIAFAIARISYPNTPFWPTDIFIAVAASLLAWSQSKRFRELSASYGLAAHEISGLREKISLLNSEKEFSEFVGDAENAFSREHTQWIARRDT